MRRLAYALGLLVLLARPAAALPLFAGDVFSYEFNTLPFAGAHTAQDQARATVFLVENLLDAGERIQLEFFENSLTETPFFSLVFGGPTHRFGATGFGSDTWQDLQGVVRLTMLTGTVNLDAIEFQVIDDHSSYLERVSVTPVPEPSTWLLLGSGLVGLLGLRYRKGTA